MRAFRLLASSTLVLSIVTAACRTPANQDTASAAKAFGTPPDRRALVVVAGGWMSCQQPVLGSTPNGMFLYAQAMNLVTQLRAAAPGTAVDYLLTCQRMLPPLAGTPLWYVRSDRPDQSFKIDVAQYPQVVQNARSYFGSTEIYMIGHSYGGWVVMQGLHQTALNAKHLFTLDPISADTCKITDQLPNSPVSAGCTKAPETLDTSAIRAQVERWTNLYETVASKLHASEIPDAENRLLTFPYGEKSHHRMGFDNLTWREICVAISADLGLFDSGHCQPIAIDENGRPTGDDATVFQLQPGQYGSGSCKITAKVSGALSGSALSFAFSGCAPAPTAVAAELSCNGNQCSGSLLRLGPLGGLRRIHPLQKDYFVRIVGDQSFSVHPQGLQSEAGKVTFKKN